jgi:outer membrane protein assembly factor BamB
MLSVILSTNIESGLLKEQEGSSEYQDPMKEYSECEFAVPDNNRIINIKPFLSDDISNSRSIKTSRTVAPAWPMFKNTPSRTGVSDSAFPSSGTELWNYQIGPSFASPVLAYGKVYISNNNGTVYCFEETTGNLRWSTRVTSKTNAAISTPAVSSGYVFIFSSGDGSLYRLDALTGSLNWTYKLPGKNTTLNAQYIDHPILVYNGEVFFGAPNRVFYCLNETSGELVWRYETQLGLTYDYGICGGASAVDDEVYFGANDGYIYAMDLNGFKNGNDGVWQSEQNSSNLDGDVLWKFNVGDSICSTPTVYGNYVYMTVGVPNSSIINNNIYKIICFNRNTGSVVWDYKTGNHIVSSPAIAENRVYFGSLDGKIYSLGTDTNTTQWTPRLTTGEVLSSPVVWPDGASGRLLIGSTDAKLYCYNAQTGTTAWEKMLDSAIISSPAVVNNRIFINSKLGKLYCLGAADTKMLRIKSTKPAQDDTSVPVSGNINIEFNEPIHLTSIDVNNVMVKNSKNESAEIDIEYDDLTCTLTIIPSGYLNISEKYFVTLFSTMSDCAGNMLDGNKNGKIDGSPNDDYVWSFNTSNNHPPELTDASVNPERSASGTTFDFTVIYTDSDNNPPPGQQGIKIFIDHEIKGRPMDLNRDPRLPAIWYDNDFTNGEIYIYSKKLTTEGNHNFRIWCSDGTDWNETFVSGLPIVPGPPKLTQITDQYVKEDEPLVLDLEQYLTDPDTALDDLVINVNSTYSQVVNTSITFIYPNSFNYPSGKQFESIHIEVSDSEHYAYSEFKIWVTPVNDPPKIQSIPLQIVTENRESEIDLSHFVNDVDNEFNTLILTENSNYANIENGKLILKYPTGQQKDKIRLNVSDGELLSVANIDVKIVPPDVSFVIRDIPAITVIEDVEYSLDMAKFLEMIKGTKGNLVLNCSSKYSYIDGLVIKFTYTDSFNIPNKRDYEDVQISVFDEVVVFEKSTNIQINITYMNDAPRLNEGSVYPKSGNISTEFKFKVHYFDIDGSDNYKVQLVVDGIKHPMNKLSGEKTVHPGIEFATTMVMDIGNHYYYFTCSDGTGLPNNQYSTIQFKVFVTGNLGKVIGGGIEFNETDSEKQDLDSDGIPDYWELLNDLDPTNISDALADFDSDDFNNLLEYLGHDELPGGNDSTDPNNASDRPNIKYKPKGESSSSYESWQFYSIVLLVIIVIWIIIYYLFIGRGLGKTVRIPKMTMIPEVRPEKPYRLEGEDGEFDEEEYDDGGFKLAPEDMDMDFEPMEEDLTDEQPDDDVPVLVVDLSASDQPFLDSDEPEDDNVMDDEENKADLVEDTVKEEEPLEDENEPEEPGPGSKMKSDKTDKPDKSKKKTKARKSRSGSSKKTRKK